MNTTKVTVTNGLNQNITLDGIISNDGKYVAATEIRKVGGTLDEWRDSSTGNGRSRMLRRVQVHIFENTEEKRELFSISGRAQEFEPTNGDVRQFVSYGSGQKSKTTGRTFQDFTSSSYMKSLLDESVIHAIKMDLSGQNPVQTSNSELAKVLGQLSNKVDSENVEKVSNNESREDSNDAMKLLEQ